VIAEWRRVAQRTSQCRVCRNMPKAHAERDDRPWQPG
jgi:hypothetical protein